ncbi:MAG: hypothetical protein C0606_06535 [Hyphomicrobiales bacterium]|mgnify:CR=1 FL=1|nr:MAG: hypothetical protein C0606_06535 [Hyphomicrobiales bacterium]
MKHLRSLFVCVALMGLAVIQANAQGAAQVQNISVLPLVTSNFPPPGADPAAPLPAAPYNISFKKSGRQASCDYVSLVARLQLDFKPGLLADAQFLNSVSTVRFDFADTLPAGLHVERVHLSGDILAIPATINQVAGNPAEVTIAGIQFDPAALTPTQSALSFEVAIDARIDRAAFAAPSVIDTQATLAISTSFGPYAAMQSHDAGQPEDGDQLSGQPTSVLVDLTGCPDIAQTVASGGAGSSGVSGTGGSGPGSTTVIIGVGGTNPAAPMMPPVGGDACFELIEGEIACSTNGTYIYRMPVGPEMAGRTVSFAAQTPGVWVDPPKQVVPVGGATLEWTISGTQPGMTLSFEVTGETSYNGPAQGWGLCCTRLIEIVVPVDECPEPPLPPLKVEKSPANCPVGATECTFRMTVTNPGPNSYSGPIALVDNLTQGGASLAALPAAPWRCSSPTTPVICGHPQVTLAAGQTLSLDLTLTGLTAEQREDAVNCARLDIGLADAQLPPGLRLLSSSDCVYAFVPEEPLPPEERDPPKLTVVKTPKASTCSPSGSCAFTFEITNEGGSTYSGPINFADRTAPGLGASIHAGSGFYDCAANGPDKQTCVSKQDVTLPPGAKMQVSSWIKVDPATISQSGLQSVPNCASLLIPGVADGLESCATMGLPPIVPPADVEEDPKPPVDAVRMPPPVQPRAPVALQPRTPAPVQLQPRQPEPSAPVALQPRTPAPVQLQPRQPEPDAPVALQPRTPAPVQLQPRQPQAVVPPVPGAPVALQPRTPAPAPTAVPNNCPATMVMSADGRCVCPAGSTYDVRTRSCGGAVNVQTAPVAPPPSVGVPSVKAPAPVARPAVTPKPSVKTKKKTTVKSTRKKSPSKKQRQQSQKKRSNPGADAEAIGKIFNGIMQMQRPPAE